MLRCDAQLSYFFTVEDGLYQFIPVIAQLQQEKGRILPQKIQEDLIPFPLGQFIQKFPAKMWPALLRNLKQQGWTVDVLHDPTEFNRKEEEKRRLTAAQRAKAAQEAEARRKKAEREAMKKSIIEELVKEGLIKDKG